jgi:peptide/nickel transport system ATP-binding protein
VSLLEIRDLRAHIHGISASVRAVDGVHLRVAEGEAVGLVGESGSGKTVLALSLLGLQPGGSETLVPGSSIRFRGQELVGASQDRLRRIRGNGIAMIFQEPMTSLNPVYTVGNQIAESLALHRGLKGPQARKEIERLLSEVGITDPEGRSGRFPHELSGGMRQRAMMAMALAGEPDLLVADEPTTALDTTTQAQVLAVMKELQARRGMGLLLISHDLSVVSRVCQRVVVLYGGQVVESGSTKDILETPKHPYTMGLLQSRLLWGGGRRTLDPIPGDVPEAVAWPRGCRFHPRCPKVFQRCREDPPALGRYGEGAADPERNGSGAASGGGAHPPALREVRCWLQHQGEGS